MIYIIFIFLFKIHTNGIMLSSWHLIICFFKGSFSVHLCLGVWCSVVVMRHVEFSAGGLSVYLCEFAVVAVIEAVLPKTEIEVSVTYIHSGFSKVFLLKESYHFKCTGYFQVGLPTLVVYFYFALYCVKITLFNSTCYETLVWPVIWVCSRLSLLF